jgi:V8-like Glu-specific endopeptidase
MHRRLSTLCCATLLALAAVPAALGQPAGDPSSAVFLLITARHLPDGTWSSAGYGTAFFISPDGHALTNSHVVYRAQHDPEQYRLLAIVGHEFYSATIACASRLEYDPTRPHPTGVTFGRDIAEIQLTEPDLPFHRWVLRTDPPYELARAHEGALPAFPTLAFGRGAGQGEAVTVIGFGHISPIPREWTASGMVSRDNIRLTDGARALEITFTAPAQPGNSGSPVLNDKHEVVGILTWYSKVRSDVGWAQRTDSVTPACR